MTNKGSAVESSSSIGSGSKQADKEEKEKDMMMMLLCSPSPIGGPPSPSSSSSASASTTFTYPSSASSSSSSSRPTTPFLCDNHYEADDLPPCISHNPDEHSPLYLTPKRDCTALYDFTNKPRRSLERSEPHKSLENPFYLRPMREYEVDAVAQICYDSFETWNKMVNLMPEYPEGPPIDYFKFTYKHDKMMTVVAVDPNGDRLAGTSTIDYRDTVAGIGPVAVAPSWWDKKLGKFLMDGTMETAEREGKTCITLMSVNSNPKSYALYARMGFLPVDSCISLSGFAASHLQVPLGYEVRRLTPSDIVACDQLYTKLFPGFSRLNDIKDAIEESQRKEQATAFGVFVSKSGDLEGRLCAYTTGLDLHGHIVAEDREAFKALIVGASGLHYESLADPIREHAGIEFHLSGRVYSDLLDWLFNDVRLQVTEMVTLMARGGPIPRVKEGEPMVYSPSVYY